MEIFEVINNASAILKIAKHFDYDLDLRPAKITKLLLLRPQIAEFLGLDSEQLKQEIGLNVFKILPYFPEVFIRDINEETEEFGEFTQRIFKLISEIFKSDRKIEDTNLLELLELVSETIQKIQDKVGSDFLDMKGITLPDIVKRLSTIETESNQKTNSEKKD